MHLRKIFYHIRFVIYFLIVTNTLQSQEKYASIIASKFSYAEKIYLQLSSTIFTSDKTVWFKTIVTDTNHLPTELSGVLHVELIDFDERIIDKKLLKLEKGMADSFFQLNQNMPSGRYLIRAYTDWNRNFSEVFISQQDITIYASKEILEAEDVIEQIELTETQPKQFELSAKVYPKLINPKHRGKLLLYINTETKRDSIEIKRDRENGYVFKYVLPENTVTAKIEVRLDAMKLRNNNLDFLNSYSKTVVIDKDYLDVQFFPEGGKLVDGLTSKVAFKVTDFENKGLPISGNIVDQNDSIVKPFTTNSLGMGFQSIKADINKTYYGVIKDKNDIVHKYRLPHVYRQGFVLTAYHTDNYIRLNINSNFSKNDTLLLKVASKGLIYPHSKLKLKEGTVNVLLKKIGLPEGIIKLTLLNSSGTILCERLIFNHKEEERLKITTKTHLSTYSQRDKTILNLAVKDNDGVPLDAKLSVLVLNKDELGEVYQKQQNILSYFLLNSELKGIIEKPAHYFDEKNELRRRDLEALLLTQGWRNYIYEDKEDKADFKIEPEKTLMVSGTVGEFFSRRKKPKRPIELAMLSFSKTQNVATQKVDSTGRFNFYIGDVYTDELEFLIQSKDSRGQKKNYTINIDKKTPPRIHYEAQEKFQLVDTINLYIEKNKKRIQLEEAFETAEGTIALDEVELSNYKLTPERKNMLELHGPPDVVIEDKELHQKIQKWSYGLFSVLRSSYPRDINVRRVGRNGGLLIAEAYGADFTFIIIDGKPVRIQDYRLIGSLPTEEIKSVEIIKNPNNPRKYVAEVFGDPRALDGGLSLSFINIYTYSKKGLFGVQRTSGIFKSKISGFAPKLDFYAPKHDDLNDKDWRTPDLRSVVHWAPSVTVDANGNAKVAYYNDDNIGDILVIVEAIAPEGKIGHYESTYSVGKKTDR
jgi:hypothetical protein